MAKLTPARAEYIRRRHAEGHGVREIAREMSLDPGTISRTVNGLIWRGTKAERIRALEEENARLRARVAALEGAMRAIGSTCIAALGITPSQSTLDNNR